MNGWRVELTDNQCVRITDTLGVVVTLSHDYFEIVLRGVPGAGTLKGLVHAVAHDSARHLVPGVMHCAKCKFRVNRVVFGALDGGIAAGDNKTEPCPNGCGPLWPVTWEQEARELMARMDPKPRPLAEYHEDMGPVVWWFFPVCESAWIGAPDDSDWPGCHTHFTPHPVVPEAPHG